MPTELEVEIAWSPAEYWPRLKYAKPLPVEAARPIPGELDDVTGGHYEGFNKALDCPRRLWSLGGMVSVLGRFYRPEM